MISTTLNFSVLWNRKPRRMSSRPIAPHSARVCFAADVVGRERLVAELAHLVRVRAGEHFHDVIHPDAKAALLTDAIDAREKFLRPPSRPRLRAGGGCRIPVVRSADLLIGSLIILLGTGRSGDRRSKAFSKVQQGLPPARRDLGVMGSFVRVARGRWRVLPDSASRQ